MTYTEELQNAIHQLHGCEADFVESVPITEIFQGKTVWEGEVEVFNLRGHPKAARCYAWGHETEGKGKRYLAVLEIPPVISAQTAVRAAIIAEAKKRS